MRDATLIDVAERAGVSVGTVSNVLNRPSVVRAATRSAVEQAIDDLGYIPNASARQLAGGASRTIAYVIFDVGNPYFTDVARGVESAAVEAGMSVFLCNSNRDRDREAEYLDRLAAHRVRGVLLTAVDVEHPGVDGLRRHGIPVVFISQSAGRIENACSVSVDDTEGGALAVAHLRELGHERIAFVGGPTSARFIADRIAGSRAALAVSGSAPDGLVMIDTAAQQVDDGRRAGERILGLGRAARPTGVFCCNDLVALGLLQHLTRHGVRVPDEISIVGYDDIDFAAAAAVPLTSVAQPRQLLGRTAARLLLDEADTSPDHHHEHEHVVFSPELVARASTARPPIQ